MYKVNKERLERIRSLRQQGLTIDQITTATGYPRSSVGYIVRKYCGGRAGRVVRVDSSFHPGRAEVISIGVPEPAIDRIEKYLQRIQMKEQLSLAEILDGKKSNDQVDETLIMDMFLKDPEKLYTRLKVLAELIRFAPFLKIDPDNIRERLRLYLTERK